MCVKRNETEREKVGKNTNNFVQMILHHNDILQLHILLILFFVLLILFVYSSLIDLSVECCAFVVDQIDVIHL